jgi:hypothetical protein
MIPVACILMPMDYTVIVGSVTTLLAVVIGAELARRASRRTNAATVLMGTRPEVYGEFVASLHSYRKARLDRWHRIEEGRGGDAERFATHAAKTDMYSSLAKVELLSTNPEVAAAAETAWKEVEKIKRAQRGQLGAVLDEAEAAIHEFVKLAGIEARCS